MDGKVMFYDDVGFRKLDIDKYPYGGGNDTNALDMEPNGLDSNQALTVLMILPEHRSRMDTILQALRSIKR